MKNVSFVKMTPEQREASYLIGKACTVNVFQVILVPVVINTICLALVVYGTYHGSTLGMLLTNNVRASLFITSLIEQILVGILLGDGSIRRTSQNSNPTIAFTQGFIHLEYILWVTMRLSPILGQMPLLRQRRDLTMFLGLNTRSLPCLIPIYNLFIVNGAKIITIELAK